MVKVCEPSLVIDQLLHQLASPFTDHFDGDFFHQGAETAGVERKRLQDRGMESPPFTPHRLRTRC